MIKKSSILQIEKLVKKGFSQNEICKLTGLKKSTLTMRLKKMGLNYKAIKSKKPTEKENLAVQKQTTNTVVDQNETTTENNLTEAELKNFKKRTEIIKEIKDIDRQKKYLEKIYKKEFDIKIYGEINKLITNKDKLLDKLDSKDEGGREPMRVTKRGGIIGINDE